MNLYRFLRHWLSPSLAAATVGLWYGLLLCLIFIGLAIEGADLRYANL